LGGGGIYRRVKSLSVSEIVLQDIHTLVETKLEHRNQDENNCQQNKIISPIITTHNSPKLFT